MGLRPTQGDEKRLGPATTLNEPSPSPCHPERSRGICGSADLSWECFSTEESWACGPPKMMKNASVQQPLSMNRRPLLVIPSAADLSQRAWRDLRFRGPFVGMFFDRGVLGLRSTQGDEKRLGPATTLYEPSPSPCRPERSRPVPARRGGICGSADLSWECFSTEESWACGPPKVMKNASVQQPLSMNRRPLLVIPSAADLSRRAVEGSAVPRTFRGNVFRQRVA